MLFSRIYKVKNHVIDVSDVEWVEDLPVDFTVIHRKDFNRKMGFPYNRRMQATEYFEKMKENEQVPKDAKRTDVVVTLKNGKALLIFDEKCLRDSDKRHPDQKHAPMTEREIERRIEHFENTHELLTEEGKRENIARINELRLVLGRR